MTHNQREKIEVFISYSKQDKELRDGLLSHLRPLENEGIISWYDRQILPGTRWDDEIRARLNSADIILLLISADFLATDYCTKVEIPEALRRHEAGDVTVMPVILRHCGWEYTRLAQIQAYPEKAKPIKSWTDIDAAYLDVVREVYLAATEIKKRRQTVLDQIQQAQQRQADERERERQAARFKQQQAEAAERQRQQELDQQRQAAYLKQQQAEAAYLKQQQAEAAERQRQQELEQQRQELASEKGIDYTRLRDLLQANQWKEADRETHQRMLEAVGRKAGDFIRRDDLQNFPCVDLQTIDRLWVKYSNGHFGFSVQKKIWQQCGSPTTSDSKDWERFCVKVGWKNSKTTAYVRYAALKFNPKNFSVGELPRGDWVGLVVGGFWVGMRGVELFSRAETCKL